MPTLENPNRDWQENRTINSTTLYPSPNLQYELPKYPPIYPVAGLNSDPATALQETAPEKAAGDMSTRLQGLNERLIGQSAARKEAETKAGIPELNKTVTDLSSRLTGLKNEALAIPLQFQNDSEGRGRTAVGLAPVEMAARRNNAIQALSVSSLLEAARGNLSTAQANADRAVAEEFDPIREEIDATTKNLDLILKSPAYSLADKQRAARQLQAQEDRKNAVEEQAKTKQNINATMLIAAQYGADSKTLERIRSAGSYEEAIMAAGQFIQDPKAKYELEGLKLQNDLRRAQINTERAQAAKINSEIQTQGAPIPSVSDTGTPAAGEKAAILNKITGLKLNEAQGNAVSYAFRMIESNSNINNHIGNGTTETGTYNPTTLFSAVGRLTRTDNARTLDRDLENFVRAQLRKESGAQISDTEMEGGRKLYSPQGVLTNSKDVSATKQTREQAIESMIAQAGPAGRYLKEYFDYMKTGGLSSDEAQIIYGGQAGGSSTAPITNGAAYY